MILGKITGKTSTNTFKFFAEEDTKKFQYVQVKHKKGYNVLAQVVEIEKYKKQTIATCNIIGYKSKSGFSRLKIPLEPNSEVYDAEDKTISEILDLKNSGAYLGLLDGKEKIKVNLDLNKLITKHVAILAKSGSGKSYAMGVLIEEIIEKNIPSIIIDPHGEYSSLKFPSEEKNLDQFNIKPKGFPNKINEFSLDPEKNPGTKQLKIGIGELSAVEFTQLLPAKLTNIQLGLLYSTLKETGKTDFDGLISGLEEEENNAKWTLINIVEYIKQLGIFHKQGTKPSELIQPGKLSIINLRGVPKEVQEVIVYKLVYDLFEARKNSSIPPFFLVVEEAHNFVPERSFGEAKSSAILRTVASEGRKFGLGMAIVSQRPARVDKNILSQCSSQIILKLTNPNDIKAISSSVEGITPETEKEIKNLTIGTAMVVGLVDLPLLVKIRARKTKHGGEAIDILDNFKSFSSGKEVLNIIKSNKNGKILHPCALINCIKNSWKFNLLIDLHNARIIKESSETRGLSLLTDLKPLTKKEEKILNIALNLEKFNPAEIFSKSGLQFSEIYEILNNLVKKGYFIKDKTNYNLSENIEKFMKLDRYATSEKCDFVGVNYEEKINPKYSTEEIVGFLEKFVQVKDYKECWILK